MTARLIAAIRQSLCGVLGHAYYLVMERRFRLRCSLCGWESRGWNL